MAERLRMEIERTEVRGWKVGEDCTKTGWLWWII